MGYTSKLASMPASELVSSLKENLQPLFQLAELFPTIESMTVGQLREQMGEAPVKRTSAKAHSPAATSAPFKKKTKGGRLARRGPQDIQRVLDQVVTILHRHPDGLRAEQLLVELGLEKKELPRPIAEGLKLGAIKKTGQKRATTYFLATARAGKKTTAKKAGAKK